MTTFYRKVPVHRDAQPNFWFHMYSSTICTLTVNLVTGATNAMIWLLSCDQNDQ
ncbi:hypothetical protein DPMN_089503 [Dreissena polymorpha]|uniref:Uncharacterized protein n=1 Tax=Dreissena polymorpha TaxID=45954 RepID=A0A9D4QXD6_DREPO|nr:hypothetical protein DPMN_089503 [Dreissena polymorpha]